MDLAFTSALEQAELVRTKEASPVELVRLYLDRIERLNPTLGAYLTVTADEALEEARRAEAVLGEENLPPFHGVPIAVKDLTDTAGIRTTHGSAALADRVPEVDDNVAARIRRAGFVILGKTNTPEMGTTPWTEPPGFPPARNPWDTDRTPGGSSGGSAAAVAAGLCPIGHGSDGGGSIRIPAACCGLYGIKPSRGRVSAAPGPQSLLAQDGPLARTVADAAALLDVLAGYVAGDAWWAPAPARPFADEVVSSPGRLRVAFTSTPATDVEVAEGNVRAVRETAALLSELGHDVAEETPPWPTGLAGDFMTLWCVGRAAYEPSPGLDGMSPLNRALAELAQQTTAADYARAQARIQAGVRALVGFFERFDVLLTPTVATPPPRIGEHHDPDNPLAEFFAAAAFVPFTPPFNSTGQPAVSVPLHHDEHGLPVGVQLVGRPADEATLIRLSAQLEEARPWHDRRPPVA